MVAFDVLSVPATLPAFSLKISEKWADDGVLSLGDLIKSVLALPNIETMRFEFRDVPGVSDVDIAAMTDAWPRLNSLHLPIIGYARDPARTRPTQLTLMHVATACPNLRELVLPEIEFARLPLSVRLANHGLKTLSFDMVEGPGSNHGRWPPELQKFAGSFEVAMAVGLLFPHLDLRMREHPTPDETNTTFYHLSPPRRRISAWYTLRPHIQAVQMGRERGTRKTLRQPSIFELRISTLWAC